MGAARSAYGGGGAGGLSIEPLPAFNAEAGPARVVVTARGADKASRGIGLQPAFVLPPVPDSVLRPEHPAPPLAVEDREVAHRDPERPGLHVAGSALVDEVPVSDLRFRESIDRHPREHAPLIKYNPIGSSARTMRRTTCRSPPRSGARRAPP